MVEQFGPYRDKGAVETVAVNLTGAKYTFAVPTYVWEAGVKDVRDLQKFADKFGSKMYGIEPGGNKIMFDMIENPEFGLKGWKVVESSEQGMLAQVGKAIRKNEWIVFQGWAPHPMNIKYDMKYLTGADAYFGPNFGAATVSSLVRKGYQAECPNVAQLLKNLKFTIEMENEGIGSITEDKMAPEDAAIKAIKDNPGVLDSWLAGVETVDGKDGLPAVKAFLGL
jgi:glycine betaine/proline transport system substrate-binding protein